MDITPFFEPESCTWTYVLADLETGSAAIIDPVWVFDPVSGKADRGPVDEVLAYVRDKGCRVEWVLETHAHADHLTAAALIKAETGARTGIGPGICKVQENFKRLFGLPDLKADGSQFDRLLGEGDQLQLGGLTIRVMEVPGHTDDSIAYLVNDAVFVGDTLFHPSIGTARCDFPGGDAGKLYDSIQRLHGLPGTTRVFLCHDYPDKGAQPVHSITVAESRQDNIHIGGAASRAAFVEMREQRDATLNMPKLILPALQVNIRSGGLPAADSNGVHYLKLPFNSNIASLVSGNRLNTIES
jgi:glyoxylase-like metal-dependent hydrolase (beta-lactamase superfamily II)